MQQISLPYPYSDVTCWMLESTVTNKKMIDTAKVYQIFSTIICSTKRKIP